MTINLKIPEDEYYTFVMDIDEKGDSFGEMAYLVFLQLNELTNSIVCIDHLFVLRI